MDSEIVTEEQIRTAAYDIWLAEGQPTGEDEAHWHRARSALEASASGTGRPSAGTGRSRASANAAAPATKTGRVAPARKAVAKRGARQDA